MGTTVPALLPGKVPGIIETTIICNALAGYRSLLYRYGVQKASLFQLYQSGVNRNKFDGFSMSALFLALTYRSLDLWVLLHQGKRTTENICHTTQNALS